MLLLHLLKERRGNNLNILCKNYNKLKVLQGYINLANLYLITYYHNKLIKYYEKRQIKLKCIK